MPAGVHTCSGGDRDSTPSADVDCALLKHIDVHLLRDSTLEEMLAWVRVQGVRIDIICRNARRADRPPAVCQVDLDGFKPVNDRLGGDEFVALIPGMLGEPEATAVGSRAVQLNEAK